MFDRDFWKNFLAINIRPWKVFQGILVKPESYYIWPILLAHSVLTALHRPVVYPWMDSMSLFAGYILGFFLSILTSVLGFMFLSLIIHRIGKWLGGTGKYQEIQAAYVWCYPPLFLSALLDWMIFDATWLKYGIYSAWFVLAAWSFYLELANVAQAHKISIWQSLTIQLSIIFVLGLIYFSAEYSGYGEILNKILMPGIKLP